MEEISEKSSRPPKKALEAGCPILAVPLFLRQGWKTTKASPVLAIAPRQNVAKSVAKARKSPQCTTRNPNLINNIGGIFRKKHPTPPFFRQTGRTAHPGRPSALPIHRGAESPVADFLQSHSIPRSLKDHSRHHAPDWLRCFCPYSANEKVYIFPEVVRFFPPEFS